MFSGYGVVLDSTTIYETKRTYYVRIKLIDDSLNVRLDHLNTNDKYKYILIILGSNYKHDLPVVTEIGSILYFKDIEVILMFPLLKLFPLVPRHQKVYPRSNLQRKRSLRLIRLI